VSVDRQQLAVAGERIRAEASVTGLLAATARGYVEVFDAPACTISRVIGDLLVDLMQYQREGKPTRLGHGYLVSDYPVTRAVIEDREPRTVAKGDPDADAQEVELLEQLGFDSLLMLAIEAEDGAWGLIELYGETGQRFTDADLVVAQGLANEVGETLRRLERRG
jgi:GAF domain-containing protein